MNDRNILLLDDDLRLRIQRFAQENDTTPQNMVKMAFEAFRENEAIPRSTVYQAHAGEAAGFYNVIITVASATLGGSLVFLEKVAPNPSLSTFILLCLGWLSLLLSIAGVVWTRYFNLASGTLALVRNFQGSERKVNRARSWSFIAIWGLLFGIALLMTAGAIESFPRRLTTAVLLVLGAVMG